MNPLLVVVNNGCSVSMQLGVVEMTLTLTNLHCLISSTRSDLQL